MDHVVFLNPRTCGIYKDGGTRFKTNPDTGLRTTEIDNQLAEQVDRYLRGIMPDGAAKIPVAGSIEKAWTHPCTPSVPGSSPVA